MGKHNSAVRPVPTLHREGGLLFLEENPDIIPPISNDGIAALRAARPDLHEDVRQRLLQRARFQVSFARPRQFP